MDQQRSYSEAISNAYTTLLKANPVTITKTRIQNRLQALEDEWWRFRINDEAINLAISKLDLEFQAELKQNSYFSQQLYRSTYDSYLETIDLMTELLNDRPPPNISNATSASLMTINPTSGETGIADTGLVPSPSIECGSRPLAQELTPPVALSLRVSPVQTTVMPSGESISSSLNHQTAQPSGQSVPLSTGASSISDVRTSSLPAVVATTSTSQVVPTHIPLQNYTHRAPRLDLPKYDGNLSDWLSFRDLFLSLIYLNPSLSAVEKLQYLKLSLIGPASHLLKNTNLTAANFLKAWEAVVSFYENRRLLIRGALKSLHSVKKITAASASDLQHLYTTFEDAYRNLESLGRPIQYCDDFLVFLGEERLDPESARAWELSLGSSTEPATWSHLKAFILARMRSLQAFEQPQRPHPGKIRQHIPSSRVYFTSSTNKTSSHTAAEASCPLCSDKHWLNSCQTYLNKTSQQRREFVLSKGLCFNCLGQHRIASCRSLRRCNKCGRHHHTTLHRSDARQINKQEEAPKQVNHASSRSLVLLATVRVKVRNEHDEVFFARGLLDQGSEVSLVTENFVQRSKLNRSSSAPISILGLGANQAGKTKGQVKLKIQPHFSSCTEFTVSAYILPKLTSTIPAVQCPVISWPRLNDLPLADPNFAKPDKIDFIIGADLYGQLLEGTIIKDPFQSLVAQQTKLGWIVSGPLNTGSINNVHHHHCLVDNELNGLLERFWHQEEIPSPSNKTLSSDDQQCEDHFRSTYARAPDGRYIVRLPFKSSPNQLGDSKDSALHMLNNLQRKFKSNPNFFKAYSTFMTEYENLRHMTQVSERGNDSDQGFYLPHHGVIRESSLTTKLRVVFNGSCRTKNGHPLNELLHTGAKLQEDLFDVLIWFRMFKYVFSTDMERMYRQIGIHPDDWKYQRILWKSTDKIRTYCLTTVTYGLACAPFLALRTIRQLLDDEGQNFPMAVDILTKGRYVDDIFGGADTIEEAKEKAKQVSQLCMAGGFPLKKWTSNHPDVLEAISSHDQLTTMSVQLKDNAIRALGLFWTPPNDSLHFNFSSCPASTATKRAVLSKIAQLFDPLGLLSPILIKLKIFMQELWAIKLSWDEQLAPPQASTWQHLQQSLNGLETITIPRWIGFISSCYVEIHGFSDASQLAMAAAVYIKTIVNNRAHVALLCSKTKVSPLKRMTIPRLELVAAVMLTKLVHHCCRSQNLYEASIHLWTDSSIVYTWLNNHPSKWKEFIHNRVCYIQETLPSASWRHVSGKVNPADCATRGLSAAELQNHHLWWTGPSWLVNNSEHWPNLTSHQLENTKELEQRSPSDVVTLHATPSSFIWDTINRYSSLNRLLRITTIILRALNRMQKRISQEECSLSQFPISPDELNNALSLWIRLTQNISFQSEIRALKMGHELPRSRSLIPLLPFVDNEGLLRVGGRLRNSSLSITAKQPYILPRDSPLTNLVIRNAHYQTLHGSTQDTLNYIRNNCWVLGGRAPVRSFILKCVTCTRYRRTRAQQLMGQLPPSRVNPARAFLHSGVDYAGPFFLKTVKGRSAKTYKSWVALFVCHATSAIHLELVTDYTSDAFIAAYKRFISRRGICSTLSSDCGSNFKGANRDLRHLFSKNCSESNRIASLIANDGTKWNFNPPASPHFGGKWEAGVKSMKYHLKRIVGDTKLTYEEMTTILTQIESILNSRPLCSLTEDPEDLDVLTPGHFLIGQPLTLVPEPKLEHLKITRLSRWQHLSQMVQSFWTRWSKGYLQRFQSVYKWNKPITSISKGTLALILDERYPPSKWPIGQVIETHPGPDNLVRVVTLRTSTGNITRPIVKLCPLPISASTEACSPADSAKAGGKC